MRLDVPHLCPRDPGETLERAQLVDHLLGQRFGFDVDEPPSETRKVAVADLGAQHDTPFGGPLADPSHGRGVTGMKAARHVRAGHHLEQRVVVAECPPTEPLPQIAVEVDRAVPPGTRCLRHTNSSMTGPTDLAARYSVSSHASHPMTSSHFG